MQVRDIMTPKPAYCLPTTNLHAVARLMVEHVCGAIPVVDSAENLKPVGVITDRDITCRVVASGRNPLDIPARVVMTSPVVAVNPETPLEECVQHMEREEVRRALVVDEQGRLCGIVSEADIARNASEHETAELARVMAQPFEIPSRPAAAMPRIHH